MRATQTFRWSSCVLISSLFLWSVINCSPPPCLDGVINTGDDSSCVHKCEVGKAACGTNCVDPKSDATNCGLCGNTCRDGESCIDGKCDVVCQAEDTKCSNTCVNVKADVGHCGQCGNACQVGEVCQDGVCTVVCEDGKSKCGEACVDTQADAQNCGACGTKCEVGKLCVSGTCDVVCTTDRAKCEGACVDTQTSNAHCGACASACKDGEICKAGKCESVCGAGQERCGQSCVDTQSSNAHCGTCGTQCPTGEVCSAGKCDKVCPQATPTVCAGGCFDLKTSPLHCGGCGTACATGQSCVDGKCECPTGQSECQGACVDLQADKANCGACGTQCKSEEVCSAGKCDLLCPTKTPTNCNGACVDLQTNNQNCGACTTQCKNNQQCVAGKCACPTGLTACGDLCLDTQNDRLNCGSCGNKCGAGSICDQGKCVLSCAAGLKECSNACVNTDNNPQFCGDCNTKCQTGQYCDNGKCANKCSFTICNNTCIDTQNDRNNCGTCGNQCAATQTCTKGLCKLFCQAGFLDCGGTCIDLSQSNQHCGACNNACTGKNTCVSGQCSLVCTGGLKACQGNCIDYNVNKDHCGGCGNACATKEACISGTCVGCDNCPIRAFPSGGTNYEEGSRVAFDDKGNIYVTGRFTTSTNLGQVALTAKGSQDVFVAKLDSNFGFIWVRSLGGTGSDNPGGLAVDSKGNVYVSGWFNSDFTAGTTTFTTKGSNDGFVVKYDNAGSVVWAKQLGFTSSDIVYAVSPSSDGGLFLGGQASGSLKVGTTTYTTVSTDAFVAKMDDKGDIQWLTLFKATSTDIIQDIAVDGSDNIYTAGYFYGTMPYGTSNLSSRAGDLFVAKVDKTGKVMWVTQSNGVGFESGYRIAVDATGNTYVSGQFSNTAVFGSSTFTSRGSNDFFALKIDTGGQFVWSQAAGTLSGDVAYGIDVDTSGNVYVAADFNGSLYLPPSLFLSKGNTDIILAKYSSTGKLIGAVPIGGTSTDRIRHLKIDTQNNVFMTGAFSGSIQFGKITLGSTGSYDFFLAKYGAIGCPSDQALCNGECTSLDINKGHCGTCGSACAGTNVCEGGLCRPCYSCPTGQIDAGSRSTNDYVSDVATDAAGNIYITGYFSGTAVFGSTTFTSKDRNDFFVLKLDATGKQLWAYANGGINNDYGRKITVDASGNVYVAGSFFRQIDFGNNIKVTSQGYQDPFIVKFSSTGTPLWANSGGSPTDSDEPQGIAIDSKGNVFVTGYFARTGFFGTTTLTTPNNQSNRDIFLAKFDSTGKYVSVQQFGSSYQYGSDEPRGIAVDASDNLYMAGQFSYNSISFGSFTLTASSSNQVFVAKWDAAGKLLWATEFGGTSTDQASAMALDASGNTYVTGRFYSNFRFGTTTLSATGNNYDVYVAKVDTTGKVLWGSTLGNEQSDNVSLLTLDGNGHPYIAGYFSATLTIAGQKLLPLSNNNVYIAKLDDKGQWKTAISGGTASGNAPYGLIFATNGDFLFGYQFYREAYFGGQKITSQNSNYDITLIRFKALP